MENNGKFCSQPVQKKKGALKTGWSYVSWGAKAIKNKAVSSVNQSVNFINGDSSDISEEGLNTDSLENTKKPVKLMN